MPASEWGFWRTEYPSNAAQLITSVLLLRSGQTAILQTSLVGAVLSNLLLMTGLGFLAGGINHSEQRFNIIAAQTTGIMLLLAVLGLMVPTAAQLPTKTDHIGVIRQSRGTSIILICAYGMYLLFQLKTHASLYRENAAMVSNDDDDDAEDAGKQKPEPQLHFSVAIATLTGSTVLLTFNTLFATDSINRMLE